MSLKNRKPKTPDLIAKIRRAPSLAEVARAIGAPPKRVSDWCVHGRVPDEYRAAVDEMSIMDGKIHGVCMGNL